ncbi:MAG: hypothetical protein ACKV2O_05420 [Acidimicrobiales bacterium]
MVVPQKADRRRWLGETVPQATPHRPAGDHHIVLALTRAEAGVIPGLWRALGITPAEIEIALR